jgi:hypothetical protein
LLQLLFVEVVWQHKLRILDRHGRLPGLQGGILLAVVDDAVFQLLRAHEAVHPRIEASASSFGRVLALHSVFRFCSMSPARLRVNVVNSTCRARRAILAGVAKSDGQLRSHIAGRPPGSGTFRRSGRWLMATPA